MVQKFLKPHPTGRGMQEVAAATTGGAPDANQIPELDANGRLPSAMMPTGIGADTATIVASENIAAGGAVNIYDNGGTISIRNADRSSGKPAHGFIREAVNSAANGEVYFEGNNDGVTGLTPGQDYWLGLNGAYAASPTNTATEVRQYLGVATSATSLNWEAEQPIVIA